MANRHFAKVADVWKHLVLTEVLGAERPLNCWDSHAGHASYEMSENAERRYGVLSFMELAGQSVVLSHSRYYRHLAGCLRRDGNLPSYPAGPMLAMLELGAGANYIFCDLDPESVANIEVATAQLGLEPNVRVYAQDGMSVLHDAVLELSPGEATVVHIDPFDHDAAAPERLSALDLAGELVRRGVGVVYWYGFNRADQRFWIYDRLEEAFPEKRWWCGEVMISSQGADMFSGDLGDATSPGTGFGVVCANVSDLAEQACGELGKALAVAYEDHPLPDGRLGSLEFAIRSS